MVRTLDWHDKVVLVTGGSSGLGRIIAESFARRGAKLVLVAIEKEDLERAAAEIASAMGVEVLPIHADITKQQDVDRVFQTVRERFARLDVLVNNAGRSMRGKILETSPEQFQSLFDLNVLGTVRCTQAAAAMLLEQHGSVVNIGSLAAKSASRWVGAYPVSKHAVAAFSQQLRLELGPEGLHVLLVCPGPIKREQPRLYGLENVDEIPESAREAGGGVKVRKVDPVWLGDRIVRACEKRQPELVVPAKARLLFAIQQLFPTFGDWLVLKFT